MIVFTRITLLAHKLLLLSYISPRQNSMLIWALEKLLFSFWFGSATIDHDRSPAKAIFHCKSRLDFMAISKLRLQTSSLAIENYTLFTGTNSFICLRRTHMQFAANNKRDSLEKFLVFSHFVFNYRLKIIVRRFCK